MLLAKLAIPVLCFVAQSRGEPADQLKQTASGPLDRQLRSLVLRRVECRDANLSGTLEYLKQKAAKQSGGTIDAVYRLDVPEEVALSPAVTLSLTNVPFLEALRYVGELADVNLRVKNHVIVAELHDRSSGNIPDLPEDPGKASNPPVSKRGLSGLLGRAAQPVTTGRNFHRSTGGEVQHSKSGYIKHRSASGWPIAMDPHHTANVNCSERVGCRMARHIPTCPMHEAPKAAQPPQPK